ncbi:hypothetical protein [uncultured Desulfobacter sp.]|uniref:hypothetical protein n=1 Tax=uncultured Desulfobacter sp. TaxID=240139 RepID=UPI002AA8CEB6|nr:hypothetical protein [uncultured Desulfobacter sp.]
MNTHLNGHKEIASSGNIRKEKPMWLKKRMPKGGDRQRVTRLLSEAGLHTVCQEAACPNMFECFAKNTATFMIPGFQGEELRCTFQDLYDHGCNILTVGQYLQPTREHLCVEKFYTPEEFEQLEGMARDIGFQQVAAGPFVRSSYNARELFETPEGDGQSH